MLSTQSHITYQSIFVVFLGSLTPPALAEIYIQMYPQVFVFNMQAMAFLRAYPCCARHLNQTQSNI